MLQACLPFCSNRIAKINYQLDKYVLFYYNYRLMIDNERTAENLPKNKAGAEKARQIKVCWRHHKFCSVERILKELNESQLNGSGSIESGLTSIEIKTSYKIGDNVPLIGEEKRLSVPAVGTQLIHQKGPNEGTFGVAVFTKYSSRETPAGSVDDPELVIIPGNTRYSSHTPKGERKEDFEIQQEVKKAIEKAVQELKEKL